MVCLNPDRFRNSSGSEDNQRRIAELDKLFETWSFSTIKILDSLREDVKVCSTRELSLYTCNFEISMLGLLERGDIYKNLKGNCHPVYAPLKSKFRKLIGIVFDEKMRRLGVL